MKARTRAILLRWVGLPENSTDNEVYEAAWLAIGRGSASGACAPTTEELDALAERISLGVTFAPVAKYPEQPTLRDMLAMNASEEDVSAVLRENLDCVPGFGIIRNRTQARYEHADRMLKARMENQPK